MLKSSTARPESTKSKAKLTNEQFLALSKMYQPALNKLLKPTDNGKRSTKQFLANQLSGTPRTNTPKSCRNAQEFQMKYFFFQKHNNKQESSQPKLQNNSQVVAKTHQLSQHRNISNLNISTGKETPQAKSKPQTDRKYNLLSADFEKQTRTNKNFLCEQPRQPSQTLVQQLATQMRKQQQPQQQEPRKEKKENMHFSLDDFVTQIARSNPSTSLMTSPFKQTKSLSPTSRVNSTCRKFVYYVSNIIEAFRNGNEMRYQLFRDHANQTYNCIGFCLNLREPDIRDIEARRIQIPFRNNTKFKKTVVFDLDETLIHCNENQNLKADIYLPITFPSGDTVQAGINVRPFAKWILTALSDLCEVVVFTASHACYASKVISYLDTSNVLSASLFRDKCMVSEDGVHIKDLRVINRDLKDIVLIDNAAYSFGVHIENGIPIVPYYDNKDDRELKQLYDFLVTHVLPANDCRTVLQETFKLREFANYVGIKSAIDRLYL